MGLSRHLSTHPQCSLDYSKDPSIHGGIMDAPPLHHQQTNASFHAALSSVTGAHANNDHISLLPLHVEDDFVSTSSFADVDENDPLLSIAEDSTTFASNHPNSSVLCLLLRLAMPLLSDTFKDPWSNDHDDGLELSLFSVEEKVQIDLLQTLKRLKAPMIAYDEVMKWAVRSCSEGHIFATCRSLHVRRLWTSCVDVLASIL
ncbi:hypothetical protein MHU86_23154 [Fragilaria crotonensis]|nr:hypothetical protein MHU86_23154 [Fragilaria crotonensis]